MEKNIYLAYFLWLIGGVFGLHLFYLGRDRQLFVFLSTMGGYFGFAALYDFIKIPSYVRDVNESRKYMESLTTQMRSSDRPPFRLGRFFASSFVSYYWMYLYQAAVPREEIFGYSIEWLTYLTPLLSAIAVWTIGNIGRDKGDFKWALLGSLFGIPIYVFKPQFLNWTSVITYTIFYRKREWRRTPRTSKGFCRRFTTLCLCLMLFSSLWCSYLFFNAEITDKHKNKIKFRHAVVNIWNSAIVQEFRKNAKLVYDECWNGGFGSAYEKLIELTDPLGEVHSLKVLGLEKKASSADISSTYKKLVKEWHPDKHPHKTEEEKIEINEKFMKIQKAYEKLTVIHKDRGKKMKSSLKE